jgi:phage regulator Rha-like protein
MTDLIPVENITSKIFMIRGQKIMLDKDLAELYGVETRVLKQAVKRNNERFPEDFMFSLTNQDVRNLTSQIVISSWGGSRHPPMTFTEQGIAMLSTVLNSKRAIQVNIAIMRAFVKMREILVTNKEFSEKLKIMEEQLAEHDEQFRVVFEAIKQLLKEDEKPKKKIGF